MSLYLVCFYIIMNILSPVLLFQYFYKTVCSDGCYSRNLKDAIASHSPRKFILIANFFTQRIFLLPHFLYLFFALLHFAKRAVGGWAGTISDTEERIFHVICSSFVFYLFEKIVVCYLTGNTKIVKD